MRFLDLTLSRDIVIVVIHGCDDNTSLRYFGGSHHLQTEVVNCSPMVVKMSNIEQYFAECLSFHLLLRAGVVLQGEMSTAGSMGRYSRSILNKMILNLDLLVSSGQECEVRRPMQ